MKSEVKEKKMYLTKEDMDKLEKEYRQLIDVEAPAARQAVSEARAQGDLSENSEYDAARDHQAEVEARIKEIEHIKDVAIIIEGPASGGNDIFIGTYVEFLDLSDGQKHWVKLVSTVQADPLLEPYPFISNESALGLALERHKAGDTVEVDCAEPYEIRILQVSKAEPKA